MIIQYNKRFEFEDNHEQENDERKLPTEDEFNV